MWTSDFWPRWRFQGGVWGPQAVGAKLWLCGGLWRFWCGHTWRMGVVCGPILDLTYSQQYDLCDARLVAWCIAMMEQGRLRAFLVAPPCTTYSPAAFPSLRSYQVPEGYDQKNPRVWLGNRLAYAALCLLFAGLRLRVFGLGEQPRRSKMRWLRHWKRLLLLGAIETWTASCAFGSPHRKEFCFLSVGMDASSIHRPCPGNHAHIPIQGVYTKPSAVYTPGLALALATLFRDHLRALDSSVQRLSLRADGLEDLASDDLCVSLPWRTHSSWKWKGKCHVNLLEAAATLKLYRSVALDGGDARFVYLGDSHVARSSLARGRTSSHALRPLLKQASSLCIGYGLYPAGRFAPTRWNPADHPTRGKPIPDPVPSSLLSLVDSPLLYHGFALCLNSVVGLLDGHGSCSCSRLGSCISVHPLILFVVMPQSGFLTLIGQWILMLPLATQEKVLRPLLLCSFSWQAHWG